MGIWAGSIFFCCCESVNMDAQVSLGMYPGVEEMAYMVILLIFWETHI